MDSSTMKCVLLRQYFVRGLETDHITMMHVAARLSAAVVVTR